MIKKLTKSKKIAFLLAFLGILLLLLSLFYILFLEKKVLFYQAEKTFEAKAQEYFFHYPKRLPVDQGEVSKVTLQELYDLERIEPLYVPKKNKLCSSSTSWVKVMKKDEETYTYYTYLECDSFKSKVDSKGPILTLEGEPSIYVPLGSSYVDPGVASVVDEVDGEIDPSQVIIDTSYVDTSKIGEYSVKYTIFDKLKNRTDVTRSVHVVRKLSDEVKSHTGSDYIYQGRQANNYVYFSGMLWRIVNVTSNDQVTLILDDNIANLNYLSASQTFSSSYLKEWLNTIFYSSLKSKDFIAQDASWCERVAPTIELSSSCDSTSSSPVGMLSLREYFQTFDSKQESYLNGRYAFWLLDKQDDMNSYMVYTYHQNKVIPYSNSNLVGVRPVIRLKGDITYVRSGNGSGDDPYRLNDYEIGKDNDFLRDRYVGEYVNYSGQYFRIMGFDGEGNIKLISAGTLLNSSTNQPLLSTYSDTEAIKRFNPMVEGNLGYLLNQEIVQYVNDRLLLSHHYDRPIYREGGNYLDYPKEEFQAMISLPTSYDLFSGVNNNEQFANVNYLLLDVVEKDRHVLMMNTRNGIIFDVSLDDFPNNAMKIVVHLKHDAKIASGKGTLLNPYYVK